jgi:hypothetical protein
MEHNARHMEQPQDYWLPRLPFQRGLALVYLIAFVVAVNQFRPLLGEHGLLPVPLFVKQVAFRPNCSKAMAASLGCYGPIRFPGTFRALSEPDFMGTGSRLLRKSARPGHGGSGNWWAPISRRFLLKLPGSGKFWSNRVGYSCHWRLAVHRLVPS